MTPNPIIDVLWPDGALGFIGGPPKAGKSSYALEEALALANGWPVLGHYNVTAPTRVLFISEEDDTAKLKERFYALKRQHGDDPAKPHPEIAFCIHKGVHIDDQSWLAWLRRVLVTERFGVVYLDALWRMVEDPSLERSNQILAAVAGITAINRDLGTAFRVVHHATKRTGRVASGQHLLGGPTLRGWAQSSLMFGESVHGASTISYEGKGGSSGPVCRMRVLATEATVGQRSLFTGLERVPIKSGQDQESGAMESGKLPQREQEVLDLLVKEPRTAVDLIAAGVPKRTVYSVVEILEAKGLIEQGDGKLWRPARRLVAA